MVDHWNIYNIIIKKIAEFNYTKTHGGETKGEEYLVSHYCSCAFEFVVRVSRGDYYETRIVRLYFFLIQKLSLSFLLIPHSCALVPFLSLTWGTSLLGVSIWASIGLSACGHLKLTSIWHQVVFLKMLETKFCLNFSNHVIRTNLFVIIAWLANVELW